MPSESSSRDWRRDDAASSAATAEYKLTQIDRFVCSTKRSASFRKLFCFLLHIHSVIQSRRSRQPCFQQQQTAVLSQTVSTALYLPICKHFRRVFFLGLDTVCLLFCWSQCQWTWIGAGAGRHLVTHRNVPDTAGAFCQCWMCSRIKERSSLTCISYLKISNCHQTPATETTTTLERMRRHWAELSKTAQTSGYQKPCCQVTKLWFVQKYGWDEWMLKTDQLYESVK